MPIWTWGLPMGLRIHTLHSSLLHCTSRATLHFLSGPWPVWMLSMGSPAHSFWFGLANGECSQEIRQWVWDIYSHSPLCGIIWVWFHFSREVTDPLKEALCVQPFPSVSVPHGFRSRNSDRSIASPGVLLVFQHPVFTFENNFFYEIFLSLSCFKCAVYFLFDTKQYRSYDPVEAIQY